MGIALHQPSVEKIKNQITSMISRFRPGGSSAIPPSPSAPMDWKKKVAAWDSNTMAAKLRARSKKMSDGGFSFYGKVLTILLCSYFLADGLALWMAASIPAPPPTAAILDSYLGGLPLRKITMRSLQEIFSIVRV